MTRTRRINKIRLLLWLLLLVSLAAAASLVVINANDPVYRNLSNVAGTTVTSEGEIRTAGLTQIAVIYRSIHGRLSLPKTATFKVIWTDGSSETAVVVHPLMTVGAAPVPGTQKYPKKKDNDVGEGAGGPIGPGWPGNDWDGSTPPGLSGGRGGVNCSVALVLGCG